MKTFYTVRDIEDMHAAGTAEIQIHDDVVLTDVAREKAIALGMRLTPVDATSSRQGTASNRTATGAPPDTRPVAAGLGSPSSPQPATPTSDDAAARIKAAVVARLGTHKYDDVLDAIIPQVMAKLGK